MVNAELQHNPYLLETEVKFNGQEPKINSQIEKFCKCQHKNVKKFRNENVVF